MILPFFLKGGMVWDLASLNGFIFNETQKGSLTDKAVALWSSRDYRCPVDYKISSEAGITVQLV